jgi:hypothetical protein
MKFRATLAISCTLVLASASLVAASDRSIIVYDASSRRLGTIRERDDGHTVYDRSWSRIGSGRRDRTGAVETFDIQGRRLLTITPDRSRRQ